MQQGLIDIRKKAEELAKKSALGIFEPYPISCGTLIAILDELEAAEQSGQLTDGDSAVFKHLFGVENMPVRKQNPRQPTSN